MYLNVPHLLAVVLKYDSWQGLPDTYKNLRYFVCDITDQLYNVVQSPSTSAIEDMPQTEGATQSTGSRYEPPTDA
jgi:hypothetical protein